MKQKRDRDFAKKVLVTNGGYFSNFLSIMPNIIFIVALFGFYYYSLTNPILSEYETLIYWIVKILACINIITASARSILMPILSLLALGACIYAGYRLEIAIISIGDIELFSIVTVIGFIINLLVD